MSQPLKIVARLGQVQLPTQARAPVDLPPQRLAEALAILIVEVAETMPAIDRRAALERVANRLDDRGRTPNGTEAASLLGAIGNALFRLGC